MVRQSGGATPPEGGGWRLALTRVRTRALAILRHHGMLIMSEAVPSRGRRRPPSGSRKRRIGTAANQTPSLDRSNQPDK